MSENKKSNCNDVKPAKQSLILGVGHPLLDIIANVSEEFLQKYHLQKNNTILADLKLHANLCQDLIENYNVQFVAGGSVQNTIRIVQWFFDQPWISTIMGCLGDDKYGENMKHQIENERVNGCFMTNLANKASTGTCACLINNDCRSLVTFLGATQCFKLKHIQDNLQLVDRAKIIYTSGYFIVTNPESVLFLAQRTKIANRNKKSALFALNLSASYVARHYYEQILKLLPYVDYLFGNSDELLALALALSWPEKDLKKIVQKLANLGSQTTMVIITQGPGDIIVAKSNENGQTLCHPVSPIPLNQIVDTNGAGDAFVGGFLAYQLANRSLTDCLDAGIYAAREIIQTTGCTLPSRKNLMKLSPSDY